MAQINVQIMLVGFANDISFDNEVDELLNKLSGESINEISYDKKELNNNIEFEILSSAFVGLVCNNHYYFNAPVACFHQQGV